MTLRLYICLSLLACLFTTAEAKPWPKPRLAAEISQPTQTYIAVGNLLLPQCAGVPAYYGQLNRPFDPTGEVSGSLPIGFEYYPRQDQAHPALGTIVAVEGGPGYPSTGSYLEYLTLFKPLLNHRNLLLVDNRGTGKSQVIDCPPLQLNPIITLSHIAQCGAQLGERSDLYGTALATDDLAAVLDSLQTGKVDLYGDSYGTYFSQTFTARHSDKVRSVVLDRGMSRRLCQCRNLTLVTSLQTQWQTDSRLLSNLG